MVRGSRWFFQIRAFRKYFRLITFDNRGVGKTDKPGESYTTRTMADDTIGLMDCLGIDKAHILGVSLGGMIAQEVAINYPQRVRKLVLVSTTAGADETSDVPSELLRAAGVDEGSAARSRCRRRRRTASRHGPRRSGLLHALHAR